MDRVIIKQELEQRLKNLSTYEDFKKLEKDMREHNFAFFGKRRYILLIMFSQGLNKSRINYLYDDGISEGNCYIKNLYKVAKINDYLWG